MLPSQIGFPVSKRSLLQLTLELLHEFGLIDVDGDGRIEIRSLEILDPVKIGRNFLEVIQFHLVIRA